MLRDNEGLSVMQGSPDHQVTISFNLTRTEYVQFNPVWMARFALTHSLRRGQSA